MLAQLLFNGKLKLQNLHFTCEKNEVKSENCARAKVGN